MEFSLFRSDIFSSV